MMIMFQMMIHWVKKEWHWFVAIPFIAKYFRTHADKGATDCDVGEIESDYRRDDYLLSAYK